tara:strand:+ start:1116 stop:1715 length:600 start_codon:yes stop_codon:yes gene_type:complete
MSKWSSNDKTQKLYESFRSFVHEDTEVIEELFGIGEGDIMDRYEQAKSKNRETEFWNSLSDEEKDELWPQLDKLSQRMNDRHRFAREKREADNTPDESGITPARRRAIGQEEEERYQSHMGNLAKQKQGQAQLRHRQGREKESDQRRTDFDDPGARTQRQQDRRDDSYRRERERGGYGMEESKLYELVKQIVSEEISKQ